MITKDNVFIGMPVWYWPLLKPGKLPRLTQVESEPWQLGHGDWCCKLRGEIGGIALTHIQPAWLSVQWLKVDGEKPKQEHGEVIGFSQDWIDEDFNPQGTRVCFRNSEGGFTSAKWWDSKDAYVEINDSDPSHYMVIPEVPGNAKQEGGSNG